jgi:hypothetical protein
VFLTSPRGLSCISSFTLLYSLKGSTSFVTTYASATLNTSHTGEAHSADTQRTLTHGER